MATTLPSYSKSQESPSKRKISISRLRILPDVMWFSSQQVALLSLPSKLTILAIGSCTATLPSMPRGAWPCRYWNGRKMQIGFGQNQTTPQLKKHNESATTGRNGRTSVRIGGQGIMRPWTVIQHVQTIPALRRSRTTSSWTTRAFEEWHGNELPSSTGRMLESASDDKGRCSLTMLA